MKGTKEYEDYKRLREGLNLLQSADTRAARINSIPVTKNTKPEHWWGIAAIARELVDQGCNVVCEARFRTGGLRADIFVPELSWVIEVLHSETLTKYAGKEASYKQFKIPVDLSWITTSEIKGFGPSQAVKELLARKKGRRF